MMEKKILILVDDNPTTLFYNKDVLSDIYPDRKIVSYDKCDLFLEDYLAEKYKTYESILLFLDINMPSYSGFEILEEIEENDEDSIDQLKVIMLTSSRLKSDFEKSSRFTQIIGYIEKPLTNEKLTNCLNSVI